MPLSRLGKQIAEVAATLNADAANYARGDERTDFLYAGRPIARRLLAGATELETALGKLRVVSAEGLIGFKQFNEPPFAAEGGLDAALAVPGIEDPYQALDNLMAVVEALCPIWPPRETLRPTTRMLL